MSSVSETFNSNFYPRPPRGGRPQPWHGLPVCRHISIHALREEGDPVSLTCLAMWRKFLSTPSARRATASGQIIQIFFLFLSTPSARRATGTGTVDTDLSEISIHALREEGDKDLALELVNKAISIHALREEGDRLGQRCGANDKGFLSTPSARRATNHQSSCCWCSSYFYPRPPRGGRQQKQRQNLYFQTNYTTFCTNLEEP